MNFEVQVGNFTVNTIRNSPDCNHSNFNVQNTLIFLHQNIRSLRANFHNLVANLNTLDRLPDLIFVSEIWIYYHEVKDFNIPNYNFYAVPNSTYAAGGVGVFIKIL